MIKLIRERYAGRAAASAVLIVGLIGVSSLIAEIRAFSLAVEYGDGLLQRTQSQPDASPVATRVVRTDQRGLILYFLMEATRAQSR